MVWKKWNAGENIIFEDGIWDGMELERAGQKRPVSGMEWYREQKKRERFLGWNGMREDRRKEDGIWNGME
jgi:hypothetical protein